MSEIKLFIATSLDGFIARENGSLDWLHGSGQEEEASETPEVTGDGGYAAFLETVDVIVVGRSTYEEILAFGIDWPYAELTTYVVSTNPSYETKTPKTELVNSIDGGLVDRLKMKSEKHVWIMGGGQLVKQFMNLDAIDEMTLSVMSIVLGEGIRLFPEGINEKRFVLSQCETYGKGLASLTYLKR